LQSKRQRREYINHAATLPKDFATSRNLRDLMMDNVWRRKQANQQE